MRPSDKEEPERHKHATRLELPNRVAEGSDDARVVYRKDAHDIDCPWLVFAVETSDIEALNQCTVEAKRKAKWPPQGTSNRGHATGLIGHHERCRTNATRIP